MQTLADYGLKDSEQRLQYQHEYTLAGLKTLIWMNGGAIIGLLTYAGNATAVVGLSALRGSFAWYIGGLIAAALAYLTAYASQSQFMGESTLRAMEQLGVRISPGKSADQFRAAGNRSIAVGVVLCLASLVGFSVGSGYAVSAVSAQQTTKHAPHRALEAKQP